MGTRHDAPHARRASPRTQSCHHLRARARIPVTAVGQGVRALVFVFGAPLSGTTLVGSILGSHSRATMLSSLDRMGGADHSWPSEARGEDPASLSRALHPTAALIHVVRDPRMAVRSVQRPPTDALLAQSSRRAGRNGGDGSQRLRTRELRRCACFRSARVCSSMGTGPVAVSCRGPSAGLAVQQEQPVPVRRTIRLHSYVEVTVLLVRQAVGLARSGQAIHSGATRPRGARCRTASAASS